MLEREAYIDMKFKNTLFPTYGTMFMFLPLSFASDVIL